MVAVDIGYSIACPDNRIRRLPYIHKEDAEFDSMYVAARGCFDYSGQIIKPYEPCCPQGEHAVMMTLFDAGLAINGAFTGPCDIEGCVTRAIWRCGLIINNADRDVELKCNIAFKTCRAHQKKINVSDVVSEQEWILIARQFGFHGIVVADITKAELYFQTLCSKK